MLNEVIYNLNDPFEYAKRGEQIEAKFITILPPTMKQLHQAALLKQSFMRIITSLQVDYSEQVKSASETKEENSNIDASDVISIIYGNSKVEVNTVFLQAKELFKAGCALIDGEETLTYPLMDKMSINDFQNIVGEYIANFIQV